MKNKIHTTTKAKPGNHFFLNSIPLIALFAGWLIKSPVFAQSAATKINSTANGINQANVAANNATNTINNSKQTAKNLTTAIGGLFPKKKQEAAPVTNKSAAATVGIKKQILLSIAEIDYNKLKQLEDSLKAIAGVENTSKKFSAGNSTIELQYTGNGDELWDKLSATMKELFVLKELNEEQINLAIKK